MKNVSRRKFGFPADYCDSRRRSQAGSSLPRETKGVWEQVIETKEMSDPFRTLPPGMAEAFLPHVPEVLRTLIDAITRRVPEYARPSDARYMDLLHSGVEEGLKSFVERLAGRQGDVGAVKTTFESIGTLEAEEGRTLDAFQSALHLAARLAWQEIAARVADTIPRRHLAALAEALLVHIDDLSVCVARGFERAGARQLKELNRRRDRLAALLTADPPASHQALADLAQTCQWQLPDQIAIAVTDEPPPGGASLGVPTGMLSTHAEGVLVYVVPDPEGPGRRGALRRHFVNGPLAVGPAVRATEGAQSLRWAVDLLLLMRGRIVSPDGVAFCSDHLSTMLLFRDPQLLEALSRHHLSPLDSLAPERRDRLAETLLAWLRSRRSPTAVAQRLQVHPQTVRYRLRQIEALYGLKLRDPDILFELELVLRSWELQRKATKGTRPPSKHGPGPQPGPRTRHYVRHRYSPPGE